MYPPRLNIKIEAWGPVFWYMYHMIAISYDEEKAKDNEKYKKAYIIFYNNVDKILPCKTCANHYAKLKKQRKFIDFIDNKDKLFKWTVDNHNIVNKRLKKKELSLNNALLKYNNSPVNVNMMMKFINYIFRVSLKYNNIGIIKKIINNICLILPSEEHCIGLQIRLKRVNNLKNMRTVKQLRLWFRNNHNLKVNIKK